MGRDQHALAGARQIGGFPGVLDFWTLMKRASAANPNVLHDDRDDCVYLRFTGGTTGAAKAVMYSIDNWMATKDLHYATPDCIPVGAARLLHFGMISHASGNASASATSSSRIAASERMAKARPLRVLMVARQNRSNATAPLRPASAAPWRRAPA